MAHSLLKTITIKPGHSQDNYTEAKLNYTKSSINPNKFIVRSVSNNKTKNLTPKRSLQYNVYPKSVQPKREPPKPKHEYVNANAAPRKERYGGWDLDSSLFRKDFHYLYEKLRKLGKLQRTEIAKKIKDKIKDKVTKIYMLKKDDVAEYVSKAAISTDELFLFFKQAYNIAARNCNFSDPDAKTSASMHYGNKVCTNINCISIIKLLSSF